MHAGHSYYLRQRNKRIFYWSCFCTYVHSILYIPACDLHRSYNYISIVQQYSSYEANRLILKNNFLVSTEADLLTPSPALQGVWFFSWSSVRRRTVIVIIIIGLITGFEYVYGYGYRYRGPWGKSTSLNSYCAKKSQILSAHHATAASYSRISLTNTFQFPSLPFIILYNLPS